MGLRARPGSIPYQRLEPLRALSREDARSALRGTIAGASVSWLPGLSGGAAATLASVGTRKRVGPSQFMVVLGAVSTSTALLSVAVLFIIHRARSGAAAAVRALAGDLSPWASMVALGKIYFGTHIDGKTIILKRARAVEIELERPLAAQLDGEVTTVPHLSIRVRPRALEVLAR